MVIKKHIPNSLTLLNLFCGGCGIVFCLYNQYQYVPYFIFTALLADFLDGFVARALKVKSDLGAQLDSLADMTTFGILPSMMVFMLLQLLEKNNQLNFVLNETTHTPQVTFAYFSVIGFVYAICAALRLAKFNIDTRQTVNFIGVPTPAAAMFILGLYTNYFLSNPQFSFLYSNVFLILATIIISLLMVSELPLFSLKGNPLNYKENKIRFVFLLLCIPQIFIFKWLSLTMIIITYILCSIIEFLIKKQSVEN